MYDHWVTVYTGIFLLLFALAARLSAVKVMIFCLFFDFFCVYLLILFPVLISPLFVATTISATVCALLILMRNKVFFKDQSRTLTILIFAIFISYIAVRNTGQIYSLVYPIAINIWVFPLLFAMTGFTVYRNEILSLLSRFLVILPIISLPFAFYQSQRDARIFIAQGFEYGKTVTNFVDGNIRAFGLSLTNFHYSLMCALGFFFSIAILWNFIPSSINRRILVLSVFASTIGLFLSTTRSGLVFSVAALLPLLYSRYKFVISSLFVAILAIIALLVASQTSSIALLNSSSLASRFQLWRSLLDTDYWLLGAGIGSYGSVSRNGLLSETTQRITDSMYAGVLIQFGILGLLFFVAFLFHLLLTTNFIGRCVLLGFSATGFFLESWDYSIFTSVIFFMAFYPLNSGLFVKKITIHP